MRLGGRKKAAAWINPLRWWRGTLSRRAPTTQLTEWSLSPDSAYRREPPRPPELRQPTYLDEFDDRTLVYDAFRDPTGHHAILVGPPFHNLSPAFAEMSVADGAIGTPLRFSLRQGDRCDEVWIEANPSVASVRLFNHPFGDRTLILQPNHVHEFAGKRVLVTQSKDNELHWIFDWARFHHRAHGAEGILLYDNCSAKYSPAEILETLERAAPSAKCIVVTWPYRFGPRGTPQSAWDSDYGTYGMIEHARWRFLALARCVLRIDVDEFVIAPDRASIFALTEESPLGYLQFAGCWIVNEVPGTPQARHRDFKYRERNPSATTNWCVVPGRCTAEHQWRNHAIRGLPEQRVEGERVMHRHFRAINTSWKYDRASPVPIDPERHVVDDVLLDQMAAFLD